jgi:hypothetical protein
MLKGDGILLNKGLPLVVGDNIWRRRAWFDNEMLERLSFRQLAHVLRDGDQAFCIFGHVNDSHQCGIIYNAPKSLSK